MWILGLKGLIICFRAGHLLERSSPNLWPGFKSRRRRHVWVEFVVGSLLYCLGFPLGTFPTFLPLLRLISPPLLSF